MARKRTKTARRASRKTKMARGFSTPHRMGKPETVSVKGNGSPQGFSKAVGSTTLNKVEKAPKLGKGSNNAIGGVLQASGIYQQYTTQRGQRHFNSVQSQPLAPLPT